MSPIQNLWEFWNNWWGLFVLGIPIVGLVVLFSYLIYNSPSAEEYRADCTNWSTIVSPVIGYDCYSWDGGDDDPVVCFPEGTKVAECVKEDG